VFCPQILGQPLHHEPTRGGSEERDKFSDWYTRTLISYEAFFGAPAPADIWPPPAVRRTEKHHFVRVDRERNWVIAKPRLQVSLPVRIGAALAVLVLLCSGATASRGLNPFNWRGPDFLLFYLVLFPVCFGVALVWRRRLRDSFSPSSSELPELDGYSMAVLNGNSVLAVNTAIATLANQQAVVVDRTTRNVRSNLPEPAFSHELEGAVYRLASSSGGMTLPEIRSSTESMIERIRKNLQQQGLLLGYGDARRTVLLPSLLPALAIAIGIVKIIVGLSRGKPVGFLVALCFVSFIICLVAFARRPLRTLYGDAVLKRLQERHLSLRRLGRGLTSVSAPEFATVLGLFGMSALAATELRDLRRSLQPPPNSSGCGSSCGGGGDGGGGGGCGGGCGGCGGGGD
jgi:uncharacterized protein (TIGR04222 family)